MLVTDFGHKKVGAQKTNKIFSKDTFYSLKLVSAIFLKFIIHLIL